MGTDRTHRDPRLRELLSPKGVRAFLDARPDLIDRMGCDALRSNSAGDAASSASRGSEEEFLLCGAIDEIAQTRVGDGSAFAAAIARILSRSLKPLIRADYLRREAASGRHSVDIEMPLRITKPDIPLLNHWMADYGARMLLVECKNYGGERPAGDLAAVRQLRAGMSSRTGRVGMLVSRNGFTTAAIEEMASCAARRDSLMLPLSPEDCHSLEAASESGIDALGDWFESGEIRLLQVARE